MKRLLALASAALILVAGSLPSVARQAGSPVDWSAGVISVVGEGLPPALGTPAQKRLLAKRAATVDGYRKLAEVVEGVQVTSETTVKNLEVASDEVRAQVSGLIKGARVVEENITTDGAYEVRLEMPIFGPNSLASAVLSSSLNFRGKHPPVEVSGAPVGQPGASYSGLVVDARNLGAKAAMMPALLDEQGKEIYLGHLEIKNEDLVAQGPLSYVRSLEEAQKHPRVGAAPLTVRAKRYQGPFHADLVLGPDEANRVQDATSTHSFLKQLAVVVIL